MAERDKPDADIEFEFFEDLPTTERQAGEQPPPPPKRSGRPPIRPRGPGGGTPLLRLALLIGGAIVLAVIVILWVTSCRSDAKKGAYEDYMGSVRAVAQESSAIGEQLGDVITTRGATLEEIDVQLDGLAKQQAQVVTKAQGLEPPGPLLQEQEDLVQAMQLRESGLAGLKQAFSQIELATPAAEAGEMLAGQTARLIAGDVVYQDLFKAASQEVMKEQGITGVAVPDSPFLPSFDLVSQNSLTQFVRRLTGAGGGTTGGNGDAATGLHGNSIEGVRELPAGEPLSLTEDNTIVASPELGFEVSVKNSGDFQEVGVAVTLTIQFSDGPIKKTETIDLIDPNKTETVLFSDFANPTFAEPTTLKVSVKPVPGEENTSNNSVEYPVIFTIE